MINPLFLLEKIQNQINCHVNLAHKDKIYPTGWFKKPKGEKVPCRTTGKLQVDGNALVIGVQIEYTPVKTEVSEEKQKWLWFFTKTKKNFKDVEQPKTTIWVKPKQLVVDIEE